ncbi:hypothetical protein OH76DRAFT_1398500 [Lentinus brumalis]|uniref:Uncharacterized protein n=1 Tax=Lentinus brumalis TaxID=2498619 RepID=A0A371DNS5_9APHY|nr:hypothetical protein OH76DRAFT_1398500 [Polyporus brumalis]
MKLFLNPLRPRTPSPAPKSAPAGQCMTYMRMQLSSTVTCDPPGGPPSVSHCLSWLIR